MAKELYVGHISEQATEEDLRKLFSLMGPVTSVHLIVDQETGEFKRCGYVRMLSEVDLKEVVETLDGTFLIDRCIVVSIAKPQKERTPQKSAARRKPGNVPLSAARESAGSRSPATRGTAGGQTSAAAGRPAASKASSRPSRPTAAGRNSESGSAASTGRPAGSGRRPPVSAKPGNRKRPPTKGGR